MAFWAEPPYVERAIIVSTPRPNTSGKGNENKKKLEITIKKRETLRNKSYSILFPGYSLGNGLSLNVWCLYGDASSQFVQLILIIFFIWNLYLYYLLFILFNPQNYQQFIC